ncbi:MAG: right-handed parallel beta-helix repeat-containing protein [Bacteroidales bacterium]
MDFKTFPVLLTFVCFFLLSCGRDAGRVFYISASGNDEASGTLNRPWKTIGRVNQETLRAGDMLLFEGSSVFNGTLLIDSLYFTEKENLLTISSYGHGRAVIDGENNCGIHIRKSSRFIVKNLEIRGNGRTGGNVSDGILIENSRDFFLDSLEVSGFQHSGVHIRDCKDARLLHISAHDNGFAGIHVTSGRSNHPSEFGNENIYIGYCTAFNNAGDPTVTNNHSGNGILVSSVKGGTIEYCEAYNNGWDMPWTGNGPVGIWIWDCTGFVIQYCVSHHNKTNPVAKDGGGFDLDGGVSNSIIQYCLSYCNQGAGYGLFEFGAAKPWENNIVRYSISYNDGLLNEGSVAIWKGGRDMIMRNCEIYNNTFVNDTLKGIAVSLISNCDNFRFTNNIFVYSGTFLMRNQKIGSEKFVSNCIWNARGKFDLPDEVLKTNIITDPQINILEGINFRSISEMADGKWEAFSLLPDSPLIDRAEEMNPPFSLPFPGIDIAGTAIPGGDRPDIGAIEFIKK